MALQANGPLKLSEVMAEYEIEHKQGTQKVKLSELTRGDSYVPDGSPNNVGIPASGAIALSDFYSSERNASSISHTNFFLNRTAGSFNAFYAGPTLNGVKIPQYVESKTNSAQSGYDDAKLVMELKVRCGPGQDDGSQAASPFSGYDWIQERLVIIMGIANGVKPTPTNESTIDDDFFGLAIAFHDTDKAYGHVGALVVEDASGGVEDVKAAVTAVYSALDRSSGTKYDDDVIPTTVDYVTIRVTRGESIGQMYSAGSGIWGMSWKVEIFDRSFGDWATVWESFEEIPSNAGASDFGWNDDGYLMLLNSFYNNGAECDLDVHTFRCAVGTTTPPW